MKGVVFAVCGLVWTVVARALPDPALAVDFDGTAKAVQAKGRAEPVEAAGLSFVCGLHGQALHVGQGPKSRLAYDPVGNLCQAQGTISFWFKPDPSDPHAAQPGRRTYVETDWAHPRLGTGAIMVWNVGETVRGDLSDDADRHANASEGLVSGKWNHVAFTWDGRTCRIYVNGKGFVPSKGDSQSPLAAAYRKMPASTGSFAFSRLRPPRQLFVGSMRGGEQPMCGAMDDLRIWDVCLSETDIRELAAHETGPDVVSVREGGLPDYRKIYENHVNAYEREPLPCAGRPGEMELVGEWKAGETVPARSESFRAIGDCRIRFLDGTPYLEAGRNANDRFALRFRLDADAPLHCLEIDYPDDAVRTADLVVQACRGPLPQATGTSEYVMQVGLATGDEYANTGKMLTHRCLCWTRSDDVALIAMTARKNRPAAVGAVRVYRVKSGGLPTATVREPPAREDGWRRTFALYYEDPAICGDFARIGGRPESSCEVIDRVAALMKYTGQNLLCYPGVWYCGEIGADYMPRPHPPAYRTAYLSAFDREGLGYMPTLDPNEIDVPDGLITPSSVKDGSLHPSPVNILATGEPNPGGWHSTPPNYNVTHPGVQRQVTDWFDKLIDEGRNHPSFRGLCLHLTRHSILWFGDVRGGFNDYTVESFARDCGLSIPPHIDRRSALRGKAYADWITNACAQTWTDWRCRQVAGFWRKLAGRLAAARPDLKLMINTFLVVRPVDGEYGRVDTLGLANRHAGFDPELLKDVPNLIVCQSVLPADYRWYGEDRYQKGRIDEQRRYQRSYYLRSEDYGLLSAADYPWVNQHDRYWESAAGNRNRSKRTLDCPWLDEIRWRVGTINPSGRHALRQYAVPLRYGDVLGLSKGGFLVGTYGSEDVLVPWIQAFRALPAVRMKELWRTDDVVVRHVEFKGKSYFYVVNTADAPRVLTMTVPPETQDLTTGKALSAGRTDLILAPYDLRSFAAPKGQPSRLRQSD